MLLSAFGNCFIFNAYVIFYFPINPDQSRFTALFSTAVNPYGIERYFIRPVAIC